MSIAINESDENKCTVLYDLFLLCERVYHYQDHITHNSLYRETVTEKEIGNNSNAIVQVLALYFFLFERRGRQKVKRLFALEENQYPEKCCESGVWNHIS